MLNNIFTIFFVYLFLLTPFSLAQIGATNSVLPSIEWQKIQLEEKLRLQVESALRGILIQNQYILDLGLEVTSPSQPDFMLAPPPPVKEKIRFTNNKVEDSSGDYIIFQKIGLEAPIVADFRPVEEAKKSEFEHLWKYNQSMNIFNNLKSVDLKVSVDDRLSEKTIKKVEKTLSEVNFNLGKLIPTVQVVASNFVSEPKVKKEMTIWDKLEWVSKFANMIGLLLATLLAAIVAFILFKKYAALKQEELAQKAQAMAPPAEEKKKDEDKEDNKNKIENNAAAVGPNEESSLSGIERFKTFFKKSPVEATLIIKKWLKSDTNIEKQSLCALVQHLENENLSQLFAHLTQKDREDWKKIIANHHGNEDLKKTMDFISSQIVEEIIVPPLVVDSELCDLLLNTSTHQAAKFIQDDPSYGPLLLNVMNTKYVSSMLTLLNSQELNDALNTSFSFSEEKIRTMSTELKKRLAHYAETAARNQFLEKILELIPMATPENERPLFQSLVEGEYFRELELAAINHIPSEIIVALPSNIVGELLAPYTMNKRTELVASLTDENIKSIIVSSFAPEGSTAKEMLELELESYQLDLKLRKHIKENREKIWQKYITHCRTLLTEDAKFEEIRDSLIRNWIAKLKGEEIAPSSESELDEAA